jgi:RNA polymerase sigma-70 factor (TIGR02943 family)
MDSSGTRPSSFAGLDAQRWLERHGDYLYAYALQRIRRTEAAEDLVQETLLAAWTNRDGFAGEASERTWLTAILKRKVIDRLRRRVRDGLAGPPSAELIDDLLFDRHGEWKRSAAAAKCADPSAGIERAEFWMAMRGCLAKLPTRLHDAFVLRYLDQAAGKDISRELGLSDANLWVILHRARLRLWHCLSDRGHAPHHHPGDESRDL